MSTNELEGPELSAAASRAMRVGFTPHLGQMVDWLVRSDDHPPGWLTMDVDHEGCDVRYYFNGQPTERATGADAETAIMRLVVAVAEREAKQA